MRYLLLFHRYVDDFDRKRHLQVHNREKLKSNVSVRSLVR